MKLVVLLMLALCTGCAGIDYYPDIDVSSVPPPLVDKAMSMPAEEQPAVLSALVVLSQAGFFWQYGWTEPITGSPVVKYNVVCEYQVTSNTAWVLNVDKYNFTMQVAGIDFATRMGVYSQPSDTTNVRDWNE